MTSGRSEPTISYGSQCVREEDVEAVLATVRGPWLTQGPAVTRFEERLCEVTDAPYAVAFSSGTAALHAAASVAGLGPGSIVATSPLSFVASASCLLFVGAEPRFVDIDPRTMNLDPTLLPECGGLVAVHYAGRPLDLSRLPSRPSVVIEDAAHALGAQTPDGPVGNCAHSDMTAFSFHPVKAITTGEGGAVTTKSEEVANRLRAFRNHGIERRPDLGGWYYEVSSLGFNYRLTDIQAALGLAQLDHLDEFIERRHQIATRYRARLADLDVVLPEEPPAGWRHAWHIFPVLVPHRRRVYDFLHAHGIGVQVHYVPIYRHPMYSRFAEGPGAFPHTESIYSRVLTLPIHPGLTESQQDRVIEQLAAALCGQQV